MSAELTRPGTPSRQTVTTSSNHYARLDGLRGLAALGVFFYHANHVAPYPSVLGKLAGHANGGVALFFLLSGFLIYLPFVAGAASKRPLHVRRFYWRRAVRIFPAYWTALSVLAIYPGIPYLGEQWWIIFSLTQIYNPDMTFAGIGVAWSLCIEVSFYLVLPGYVVVVRKFAPRLAVELTGLAVLAAISVELHVWIGRHLADHLSYTLPGTFYLFAVGMAIAVVAVRLPVLEYLERWQNLMLVAAVVMFVALSFLFGPLGSVHLFYLPAAGLLFLTAVLRTNSWAQVLTSKPLVWFGNLSYAFYLWHVAVIHYVGVRIHQPLVLTVVAFALTLTIASASWYVVERPLLRMLSGRSSRPSS